jgi:hypothetical protein
MRKSKLAELLNLIACTMIDQNIPSQKHGLGNTFSDRDLWDHRDIVAGQPWSSVSRVTNQKVGLSIIRCNLQRYGIGDPRPFKHYKGPALFRGRHGENAWSAIREVDPIKAERGVNLIQTEQVQP